MTRSVYQKIMKLELQDPFRIGINDHITLYSLVSQPMSMVPDGTTSAPSAP